MAQPPLLELSKITKAFPGVIANDEVSLKIEHGEIHALLGENGAGKSTLVKMMYGVLHPDKGQFYWKGEAVHIPNPNFARNLGIAMVFQHFSLFPALSVAENIKLGLNAKESVEEISDKVRELSKRYGLFIDPSRHVDELSVGEQQRVEIVRCLMVNPKLLVMDEPTSVLTPHEVEQLFNTLRQLAANDVAILYISHKLNEIKELCEKATILRRGKVVAEVTPKNHSARELASIMIGEELADPIILEEAKVQDVRLHLNAMTLIDPEKKHEILKEISLEVRSGEIVGIAGVAGNGQVELLAAIAGEYLATRDDAVVIKGEHVGLKGAKTRRTLGLCVIPEERLGHGAVPFLSLADNAYLTGHITKDFGGLLIKKGLVDKFTDEIITQYDVRTSGKEALASSLSGGNLQKFIVGRELMQDPYIVVVSQPTWGVDAGAAALIHKAIIHLAEEGCAVLVISQDLDELFAISHRIGAICDGAVSKIYPTKELNFERIGALMGGAHNLDEVADA